MQITPLDPFEATVAVEVLTEAFREYPVMRFVLGSKRTIDAEALTALVTLFVSGRTLRGQPILAAIDGGDVVGVATITPPGDHPAPEAFLALRERTWAVLGTDARARYEMYATAHPPAHPTSHHHLNMIGVRDAHRGRGIGGALLDAVHALAATDPTSAGVSLDTEVPRNVALYRHRGYRVVHDVLVAGMLPSWTMFRPRGAGDAPGA